MNDFRAGTFKADTLHSFVEQATIFRHIDGFFFSANQLDIVFFEHAVFSQRQGAVQCSLTTHGGEDYIRTLFFDNFGNGLPFDRLDVSGVRHSRIGHDGGWVRVHQNDAITFFAQGFTSLGTRVVEFAGLTNNNWTSAEDQNTVYVCTFWHVCSGSLTPPQPPGYAPRLKRGRN